MNSPAAILGVASGAFMISFSSVFVKLSDTGPISSGFYRMFFGALALSLVIMIMGRPVTTNHSKLLWAALGGLIFAGDLTTWHHSIQSIGPGLATVLANFQVFVMIGIGMLAMNEQINRRTLLSVGLAIGGLMLLVGPGWIALTEDWRLGVILGLSTALFYTAYLLVLRHLQRGENSTNQVWNIALVSFWCSLFMAVESIVVGESLRIPDMNSFISLLAYGVLCQAIGWFLISRNIPLVTLTMAGITILLQPALSFLWDILIFDRPTTTLDFIGATVTFIAIYIGVTRQPGL
ncbi:MAG: DMT family transporter [Gammaproteobacteria bacterium]|nr:DMT family transporter [Gammaproteobacteria bacterium]